MRDKILTMRDNGERTYRLDSVDALTELLDDLHLRSRFQSNLSSMVNEGKVRKWLHAIGKKEMAEFLEPLEKQEFNMYATAVLLFHENARIEKQNFSYAVDYENVKKRLLELGSYPHKFPRISKMYNKKHGGAVLLYGPPGCGKTHLMSCLAGETSKLFLKRGAASFFSPGHLTKIIETLKKIKNVVLFIDEIEILGIDRECEGISSRAMTNEFLTSIDMGIEENGVMICGATNAPWVMDPSMLRSGRFDEHIYVGLPDEEDREDLFEFYCKGLPLDGVDFGRLVKATEFYSCSDIEVVCRGASSIPWREAIAEGKERGVTSADFDDALKTTPSTALDWMESASNIVFSESFRIRFAPMIAEVERYKRTKR